MEALGLGLAESLLPAAQVALPVQHVLSDELQQLFEQVRPRLCSDLMHAGKCCMHACMHAGAGEAVNPSIKNARGPV